MTRRLPYERRAHERNRGPREPQRPRRPLAMLVTIIVSVLVSMWIITEC